MATYELEHVLAGTGGVLGGTAPVSGSLGNLERDARKVTPGDLFIAIRGERFDGHDFVPDAAANGAAAAIVSRAWAESHPEIQLPLIVVDEPIPALQRWAGWWRDRLNARVVGITGSIGKTSAKEAVSGVLRQQFRVYHSPGNLNTEVGLPISILNAPADAEVLVLEMGGAYAFGELTLLAGIAKPDVGVVTNVYPVHLERMGTIEAIAETKSELVAALPEHGIAVLNGDDPRVRAMAPRAKGRVLFYGHGTNCHVRVDDVESNGLKGSSFWLTINRQRTHVKIPFLGAAGVQAALVALAVGHTFGLDVAEMMYGLQDRNVEVRLMFVPGPRGSQLIDDTYNASRPSMLSALDVLGLVPARRRVAVLGEMRELGTSSDEEHRVVGGRAGVVADVLLVYGEKARPLAEAAATAVRPPDRPFEILEFGLDQREELLAWLETNLAAEDVVLLKGSRGLEMEHLVAALRADAHPDAHA
jgi:UDP-N-acetylmuramoyl-tripeptide--D-alanyl-D-alanine ligase